MSLPVLVDRVVISQLHHVKVSIILPYYLYFFFLNTRQFYRGYTFLTFHMVAYLTCSPVDPPEEHRLPNPIFSTDRYPTVGRVNCYSKVQYLVDIVALLQGSEEFTTIMQSQFRSLFYLPVRRCSLSGKLVHNFLSRQLTTSNTHELWFVFGGQPIRFSLREFGKITGLSCGPYPLESGIVSATSNANMVCPYWYTLIGPNPETTVSQIVTMLKSERDMPGWRKLRLALIVIVEGILSCGTQPIRPRTWVVEMVRNLEVFLAYPWGRHAFERTIRMVKLGKKVKRLSILKQKLKQRSLVLHGFPIAIQLFLFQSIPLLLRCLPDSNDDQTFVDGKATTLPMLKTYHTHNILHVENDVKVHLHTLSLRIILSLKL